MIIKDNFKALLKHLSFEEKGEIFTKNFEESGVYLKVDFKKEELEYPELVGLKINERQTCNFSSAENAVVFECVHKLLEKGYKPKHIELEPKWKVGHGASGGRADILVRNQNDKPLLIIECKTYGKEFNKAWKDTQEDGGQLFSYAQQISETDFLCLYASEFDEKNNQLLVEQRIISHKDNEKILEQGNDLKSYKKASDVKKRYEVWRETYQLEYTETGIFENNIQPYQIGKSNYTLEIDTRPVTDKDKDGKYHRFRTILRQHNIARKETAFEVLVNLFLAKIVDEEENKTNLEFYWKGVAYDNYYDFIDRLQKLYQIGMRKFLKDDVMYISNEQIDNAFWTVKNKRNATKKQIQKVLRTLDRAAIFKIAKLSGCNVANRSEVYKFIQTYSPSKKVTKHAYLIAYLKNKWDYNKPFCGLYVSDAVRFAKKQDKNSPYCKILIKGYTNWYWASPIYKHSDYNRSKAFPINAKNDRLAFLLNNLIQKNF